ncbi:hypothetical protein KDL45_12795, partial [bacterium]|nr:hypothetical protein [bacterium]
MWTRKFALVLVLGLGRLGVAGADDDVTLFYSRQITSDDAPNIAYVPFAVHPDEPRLYAGITPRAGGDRPPKIGLAVFDTLTGEREKLNLYQAPGLDEDEQIGVLQGSLGGYATHPSDPALFVWGRSWSDDDKWRFVMIRYDLDGNEVAAERYDLEFDDPVAFAVRGGIDSDLLVLVDRPSDESLRLATFDFYGSLLDESTIEFGEDIRGAAYDILSGMDGGEPSLLIAYSQNGLPEYSDGRVVQMSFSGEVLKTIEVPLEIGEAEDINFVVPRYLTHNSRQEIYVGYTVDMSSTGWEGRLNDVIVTPDGEIRDSPVHYNTRYVTATFQELDGERKEMLAWTSTNIATNDKALTRVAGAGAAGIDDDSIW